MALTFELAGSQIDGARDYQEDAFLITHLTDSKGSPSVLVVVADGMGGHAAGNVASNMAVQALNKYISSNYPADNPAEILQQGVVKANNAIKETINETPALEGMGCTMVAALLEEGKITWASVGDSHLYLIRDRELKKMNADHSYGGFLDRMEADGTPVEPEPGLSRNMLMSAITGDDINEIDINREPFELKASDRIIICSDGLDTLSSGKIIQFSEWSDSPKEYADALMQAVEDAEMPRQDNTTAVVVNVKDKSAAKASAEPEDDDDDTADSILEATASETDADLEATFDSIEITHDETPPEEVTPASVKPQPEPATVKLEKEDTGEAKSKTGLIIGVIAVVLVAGIGGFMAMQSGDKKPASTDTDIVMQPQTDVESVAESVSEPNPEPVETEEIEEVIEEVVPEPAPAPLKQATAAASKIFSDSLQSGGNGPSMVIVPAGTFQMGSKLTRFSEEKPQHDVNVESFAVSQHEITFAEYEMFANATGRNMPDNQYLEKETYPVIFVNWDDAYSYTKWLSKETGEKYRLLSEAEWEYAASGGKSTIFWWGNNEKENLAHCFNCGTGLNPRQPTKVGSFDPNGFQIYDTAGNVAEWVHDCWHDNYVEAPTDGGVWEGGDCTQRVVRGGSYSAPLQSLRSAKRDKYKASQQYDNIGFRVARDM